MYARITKGSFFMSTGKEVPIRLELSHDSKFSGHIVSGVFETEKEALDVVTSNDHVLINN